MDWLLTTLIVAAPLLLAWQIGCTLEVRRVRRLARDYNKRNEGEGR